MPIRAEGVIETGDGEVRVSFTNYALAQIEQQTGKSILEIAEGFTDNTTGVTEVVQVLRAGMDAYRREMGTGGRAVTLRDAFAVLDEAGFGEVAAVTMEAVAEVLGYSKEGDDPN